MDLVVVDGPSLFNAVGRRITSDLPSGNAAHAAYLEEWFDIDRLVGVTIHQVERFAGAGPAFGMVVFRSTKALGRCPYEIADAARMEAFWRRQASPPDTSQILVRIAERDLDESTCRGCGGTFPSEQPERGIEASMICYLLETAERWLSVCLFATDPSLAPLAQTLRRRGRSLFLAADEPSRVDLGVQTTHSLLCWPGAFLVQDRQWFELVRKGGALDELVEAVASIGGEAVISRDRQSLSARLTAQQGEVLEARVRCAAARVPSLPSSRALRSVAEGTQATITFGPIADQFWAAYVRSGLDRHLVRLASSGGWGKYLASESSP